MRTASGVVYAGCNVENVSYPQGTCAETGAIAAMVAAGEHTIVEVLTIANGEQLTTCCGGCRQRIAEFAGPDTPVHAAGPEGVRRTFTLGSCCRRCSVLTPSPAGRDSQRAAMTAVTARSRSAAVRCTSGDVGAS